MQVLLAVVEDLYTFAVSMLFPWSRSITRIETKLYLPSSRVVSARREAMEITPYQAPETEYREEVETDEDADAHREYSENEHLQRTADVYPSFIIGAENSGREATTVRLRLVIRDEFAAILSQLPLGANEYVYYKLLRRGARIAWPDVRPRTPGSWANILGTLEQVTVGDGATVGSVMEFVLPEKAHLAYVENVFPDGTIQISEADWPDRGIYNERVLVEEEWRSLGPVFITIR